MMPQLHKCGTFRNHGQLLNYHNVSSSYSLETLGYKKDQQFKQGKAEQAMIISKRTI
jgi:hypothetical protein